MRDPTPVRVQAEQLFGLAAKRIDGFTYQDIEHAFGWDRFHFYWVVSQLRRILAAEADTINLICTPQGSREPWLYELVGTYEDAAPWSQNRVGDLETRLVTIHSVASTLVNATDGRTVGGRKARKIRRTITRLIEDLADINDDGHN